MVWKRYKCDSTTHAQWKSTWMGLQSTLFKEDRRKQVICFTFSFFWLSFKNMQFMNLIKQFSVNLIKQFSINLIKQWKLSYTPMINRKVIDNIAQVVTTNFSKNSTQKFNLHTPKIVTLQFFSIYQMLFLLLMKLKSKYKYLSSIVMCIGFQLEIDIQFNLYTWLNWTTTSVSKNMFCVSFSHAEIPLTSISSKTELFFLAFK